MERKAGREKGSVYFDTSSKGGKKHGRHNKYRAEIWIDGVRYRRRDWSMRALEQWLLSFQAQ